MPNDDNIYDVSETLNIIMEQFYIMGYSQLLYDWIMTHTNMRIDLCDALFDKVMNYKTNIQSEEEEEEEISGETKEKRGWWKYATRFRTDCAIALGLM